MPGAMKACRYTTPDCVGSRRIREDLTLSDVSYTASCTPIVRNCCETISFSRVRFYHAPYELPMTRSYCLNAGRRYSNVLLDHALPVCGTNCRHNCEIPALILSSVVSYTCICLTIKGVVSLRIIFILHKI